MDVIGIVIDIGPITTIMSSRTQQEMKKRNIKIADETAKIDITLWNIDAEEFNEDKIKDTTNAVVALKGCKVSTYGVWSKIHNNEVMFKKWFRYWCI